MTLDEQIADMEQQLSTQRQQHAQAVQVATATGRNVDRLEGALLALQQRRGFDQPPTET